MAEKATKTTKVSKTVKEPSVKSETANVSDAPTQVIHKRFPWWIIIAALILIGGYILSQKIGKSSVSGGEFDTVKDVDPSSEEQWSYAQGNIEGTRIKQALDQLEGDNSIESSIFAQGLVDAILGNEPKITEEQATEIFTGRLTALSEKNREAGEVYITEYAKGSGVTVSEAGVAYKSLESGSGEVIGKNPVSVLYTGKHIDGSVFDSTQNNNNQPVVFSSAGVIPGLGNILEKMQVGSKYEVVIPGDLAYGENGIQGVIAPNETLVFEVEVVGLAQQQAQAVAPTQESSVSEEVVSEQPAQ